MSGTRSTWQRSMAALAVVCLVTGTLPAVAADTTSVYGNVFEKNGDPAAGVVVFARHAETKEVYSSPPASAEGEYRIDGLPLGYFDIVVQRGEETYLANRVIQVPGGGLIGLSFRLDDAQASDSEWWSAATDREISGLNKAPDGVARIIEREPRLATPPSASPTPAAAPAATSSGSWASSQSWLVPAAMIGAGVLTGVLISEALDDDDDPESPFE